MIKNVAVLQGNTIILRGVVCNYSKSRRNKDFMFTEEDRSAMGGASVAAALAGLGGLATGLAWTAMDTTEQADLLEFTIDNKPIRAWVWTSVFKDGDEVEVVAEPMGEVWLGYAIYRPIDGVLALYPHCSRGRFSHFKASIKWIFKVLFFLLLFMYSVLFLIAYFKGNVRWRDFFEVCLFSGLGVSFIISVIGLKISRRFNGFVLLAEAIFSAFGWRDVKSIDLPAVTKKTKKSSDPGALGILYFRVTLGEFRARCS